jgi:ABC-type oligopeptide transport system substrate-binding subunit
MKSLRMCVLGLCFFIHSSGVHAASESQNQDVFRIALSSSPNEIFPTRSQVSPIGFTLMTLHRGLMWIRQQNLNEPPTLVPEDATGCKFVTPVEVVCTLDKNKKFSSGESLTALNYVTSFQSAFQNRYPIVDEFMALKNAIKILKNEKPVGELGVEAKNDQTLIFRLEKRDPDFLWRLAHPALSPTPKSGFQDGKVTNGPYYVKSWIKNQRMFLAPNPHFNNKRRDKAFGKLPDVEVIFVESDEAAFNLYEKGEADFLRRLAQDQIPEMVNRDGFIWVPLMRFDYLGFGPRLKSRPDVRLAITKSIQYENFNKILKFDRPPGCPSLPDGMFDKKPCLQFDRPFVSGFKGFDPPLPMKRLALEFNQFGAASISTGMQFFQHQWKKNLGLTIDLSSIEDSVFLAKLKKEPADIFRKGLGVTRPTCLAAIETFHSQSPENHIRLVSKEYDQIVEKMENAKAETERKKLCTQAVSYLINGAYLIPLGEFRFAMMVRPQFQGVEFNGLNWFDISRLHLAPK